MLRSAVAMSGALRSRMAALGGAILAAVTVTSALTAREQEAKPLAAQVTVWTGAEGCAVDVDSTPAGRTDAQGVVILPAVEAGDHYLHVTCGNEQGVAYLISPRAGMSLEVRHGSEAPTPAPPLEPFALKVELRKHIQEAVQLRARGRIEEAAAHLRNARRLDPENSDLHRELGITFLLGKDWKRARVEMLEAIRHEPDNADAYNGLGYALEKLGDLDGAVEAYRTASKLDPTDSSYRRHYFDALAKLSAQQAEKKR